MVLLSAEEEAGCGNGEEVAEVGAGSPGSGDGGVGDEVCEEDWVWGSAGGGEGEGWSGVV